MKKIDSLIFILLITLIINCSTAKKNDCSQLIDQNDFTIVNGVAFHDTFNESEKTNDEYGAKYIDPEKMEYIDWLAQEDEFKIAKGNIIKAGSISWDKKNKELIVRDINKSDKKVIKNSERRLKYKIENNITYLSEDGVKWFPIKISVSGFYEPSKENYKKRKIMTVNLYGDLLSCEYNIYATDENKIKYKSWVNWYGVVIIDGKGEYVTSPIGNADMMMSQDYINKQKEEIVKAKYVYIDLGQSDLWEKKGIITISDGYKKTDDKLSYKAVPDSERKFKYVIKDDKGYMITWDEKDCDELKVKILEKNDTSLKKNQGKPEIKFSLECKWFKGEYEIRDFEEGEYSH